MPSASVPLYAGVKKSTSIPMTAGIRRATRAPLRLGVKSNFISPPRAAYAAHLGSGVVQVSWQPPLSGTVLDYEIEAANALDGPYINNLRSSYPQSPAFVNNIPPGATAYLRIRARSKGLTFSEWMQVQRGTLVDCNVTMQCTALSGSMIPVGAMFAVPYPTGDRLMGFKANQDINFT